jgi:ubiquinone/menaquinone biosynthesis C-methylase UbiE
MGRQKAAHFQFSGPNWYKPEARWYTGTNGVKSFRQNNKVYQLSNWYTLKRPGGCTLGFRADTLLNVLETRSNEPERIDTGDYTEEEYKTFLREIRFINRWIGDRWALQRSLLKKIAESNLTEFSVLDVGAGSGELLTEIAHFARKTNRKPGLVGLDLNPLSAVAIAEAGQRSGEIRSVQGNALDLPFPDDAFDYAICSLFTHHLTDDAIVDVLKEMKRVSRRGVYVIDLHRERGAYRMYKIFCAIFRISRLVRDDGLLSIKKGFQPDELRRLAERAGFGRVKASSVFPARIVVSAKR